MFVILTFGLKQISMKKIDCADTSFDSSPYRFSVLHLFPKLTGDGGHVFGWMVGRQWTVH